MSMEELEKLKNAVRVLVAKGRDGALIGIVREDRDDVKKGMIVLFSNPPQIVGIDVFMIDYEVRPSKSGKSYVKCFKWLLPNEHRRLINELERQLREEQKMKAEMKMLQMLSTLLDLNTAKKAIELLKADQRDAVAKLFLSKFDAVFWNDSDEFLLFKQPSELIKIAFGAVSYDIDRSSIAIDSKLERHVPPAFFRAQFYAPESKIVKFDFPVDEALVITPDDESIVVADEKRVEKLKLIASVSLPVELKKRLIKEVMK